MGSKGHGSKVKGSKVRCHGSEVMGQTSQGQRTKVMGLKVMGQSSKVMGKKDQRSCGGSNVSGHWKKGHGVKY